MPFSVVPTYVADAEASAGGLVGIGRANAFQRGADFHLTQSLLVGGVHGAVGGKDEMGAVGDHQGLSQVEASLAQTFDLTF